MCAAQEEVVRVVVRCRPMSRSEVDRQCPCVVQVREEHGLVEITNPSATTDTRAFIFDAVYGSDGRQEDLYENSVRQLVSSVMDGFNGTVFAYGQTGSGKTFTMEGHADSEGVIPRSFGQVFERIAGSRHTRYLVHASFLEIYQDEIRDLMDPDGGRHLQLRVDPHLGVHVKNISSYLCKSKEELGRVLAAGSFSRITAATAMNQRSSRSHAVLTVTIEMDDGPAGGIRVGRLNLVDLAGSERQSKTASVGERLREAAKINLSLAALGNVISALVEGRRHVPYRESKLTRLLQDSLGGNAKTLMIANIGPAGYNYDESLTTLRYASRVKRIRNKPVVNEDPKDALLKVYQQEIERLKQLLREKNLQKVMNGPECRNEVFGKDSSSSQASLDRRRGLLEMTGSERRAEVVRKDSSNSQASLDRRRSLLEMTGSERRAEVVRKDSSNSQASLDRRRSLLEMTGSERRAEVVRKDSSNSQASLDRRRSLLEMTGSERRAEVVRKDSCSSQASSDRRRSLLEEMDRNRELVAKERKEVEELKEQIALMEGTLLYGVKSIVDLSGEQQAALDERRQQVELEKQREISMRQRVQRRQERRRTYCALRQQAEAKSRHLDALRREVTAVKAEIRGFTARMDASLSQLDHQQDALVKLLNKKFLIMEKFIPIDELNALIARAAYEEDEQRWYLTPPPPRPRYEPRLRHTDSRFCRDVIVIDLDQHVSNTTNAPVNIR